MDSKNILILYNTFHAFMALEVMNKLKTNDKMSEKSVSIAKLNPIQRNGILLKMS